MNKIIFVILSFALTPIFAENPSWYPESKLQPAMAETPSWYPENIREIEKQCIEENKLPPGFELDFTNNELINNPKVYALFLCYAKAINAYNEETGLNEDRLAYSYFKALSKLNCRKRIVRNCMEAHKDIVSDGEMIFNVVKCIEEKDEEKLRMSASRRTSNSQ